MAVFSSVVDVAWELAWTVGLILLGGLVHEFGHYFLSRLFGGDPFFSQFSYGIPTQVDFNSPEAMSDRQVRIAGGFPYAFWPLAVLALWFHWIPVILFAFGAGATISASDLNAAHHPTTWKKLTAGEAVTREDW